MAAFTFNLSPEALKHIAFMETEMTRLYELPDRWLAEALLKLAREARKEAPKVLGNPLEKNYDTSFVWHLVPNLAKRLGGKVLLNENRDNQILQSDDMALRELVGTYLRNNSLEYVGRYVASKDESRALPTACEVLSRDIANGNPVAMAINRLVEPAPIHEDLHDWVARYTREISYNRGLEPTAIWTPKMQNIVNKGSSLVVGPGI